MNTIIDAARIGGFPGRSSTSGSEVWDEENISISFQLMYGPAVDQRGQIGESRVAGEVLIPPANLVLRDAEHLSLMERNYGGGL